MNRIKEWLAKSFRKEPKRQVERVVLPKELSFADKDLPDELQGLLAKWREEAEAVRGKATWYAKLAKYYFTFKGVEYVLTPKPFNLSDADFEIMKIEDDLKGLGCVDILYTGMLD